MEHEENNEFPWHKVSSEWNALAMDDTPYRWYLFNSKPLKRNVAWWGEVWVEFDETVQSVIGVDMSKWKDIPWEDSLMLRPGYEQQDTVPGYKQQDTVEPSVEDTISDEEASVVGSSSTEEYPGATGRYPVVKLKHLRNLNVGDIVRLKKTGGLIKVVGWDKVGCSGCKFFKYREDQHPCYKCADGLSFTDYKEVVQSTHEPQDETFANTEMKEYADLDSNTKQLLEVKHKEGKVEWHCNVATWYKKKEGDRLLDDTVYRVV